MKTRIADGLGGSSCCPLLCEKAHRNQAALRIRLMSTYVKIILGNIQYRFNDLQSLPVLVFGIPAIGEAGRHPTHSG